MAYIIGNTTVIDNNAALGAVSGNSLNLANNANISGGGGVKSLTASSNFADTDLGSTGAIAVCVGGGAGAAMTNQYQTRAGGKGGTVIHAFALTAATNVTATVGAAGNNVNTSGSGGAGGQSKITYPTVQTHNASGGNGGNYNNPGNPGFGLSGPGTGFPGIGGGSPRPPLAGPGNPSNAKSGYVGILGL